MLTTLPQSITTVYQAKTFLLSLIDNNECYHPEDSAHDIITNGGERLFTPAESDLLDQLFIDIYNLDGNNGNHANPKFCPCGFILDVDAANDTFAAYVSNGGKLTIIEFLDEIQKDIITINGYMFHYSPATGNYSYEKY